MNEPVIYKTAVLLACFNRKQKTLDFIESLIKQDYYTELVVDIYLLDDASTDGTADAVMEKYPFIHIINGNGNLFWAGGMRTVWKHALDQKTYDVFLLFNDDVVLLDHSLENLMNAYHSVPQGCTIIVGSTFDPEKNEISYGGNRLSMHFAQATDSSLIMPDATKLIPCKFANANILLVNNETVKKMGIFSNAFTHYIADFDYTYTAHKAGVNVLIAPGYYGYCKNDHGVSWLPSSSSLKSRITYLYHPKGLAYKEYLHFVKRHFPSAYLSAFFKLWLKTLFPVIWDKFRKKETVIENSNTK